MAGMMKGGMKGGKLGQKKAMRMGTIPAMGAGASPMPMMNKGGKACKMKSGGKAKKGKK